jgi:HK97 family phage major capsid protein
MPEPKENEAKEEFIERCMGDSEAVADFPDREQRYAFCNSKWESKNMGNTLKTVSKNDDELRVANYMVLWGGKDLQGEFFSPDTEFESSYTKTGRLYVDWEHGLQPEPDGPGRDDVLGYVDWTTAKRDEQGLFVERVLDRQAAYMQYLEQLIEEGLVGTSSEAVPGKVFVTKDGEIKKWPLKRDALTVTPAEPRMLSENAVQAIKALAEKFPNLKSAIQETAVSGGESETDGGESDAKTNVYIKENKMDEKKVEQAKNSPVFDAEEYASLKAKVAESAEAQKAQGEQVSALTANVEKLLARMEDTPALKSAGYYTDDGGSADPKHKSFGDFLLAVKRKDVKRINAVYKSTQVEEDGSLGGYMVPEEFHSQILSVVNENAQLYPLVNKFPVQQPRGYWPALDQFAAPTAGVGDSAYAGGLTADSIGEGSAGTETNVSFKQLEYNLNKIGNYVPVSNELRDDTGRLIEALLTRLFGLVMANKKDYSILRGTGSNEPLGVLSATGANIGITPDTNSTFGISDAVEMLSRFKPIGKSPIWVMHRGMLPDLQANFQAGTAGMDFIQPREGIPVSLLGYPVYFSEHSPQDDNSGCVVLMDPSAYAWFEKGGMVVDFSPHVNFKTDEVVWKFKERYDGMPWVTSQITLADPNGGYTVSPFVYFND